MLNKALHLLGQPLDVYGINGNLNVQRKSSFAIEFFLIEFYRIYRIYRTYRIQFLVGLNFIFKITKNIILQILQNLWNL